MESRYRRSGPPLRQVENRPLQVRQACGWSVPARRCNRVAMKFRFGLITLLVLAGCLNSAPQVDEANVSTVDQEVQTCTSSCDPPSYNGVQVSCTSNVVCISQSNGVGCLNDDQTTVSITYCAPIACLPV
jgi:hypothetical protein